MRLQCICAAGLISFATGLGIGDYTASASIYSYSLVGTLSDGGSVSGNFAIDWGTSSGILNISSLTITDPIFSGTVLNLQSQQTQFGTCSGTSCVPFHLNSNPAPFSLGINLAFSPPDPNGSISLLLLASFSRIVAQRFSPTFADTTGDFTSASVTQTLNETPVPASLPLFATGLGVLGLLGWRRKRKMIEKCAAQGAGAAKLKLRIE